MHIVLVEDDPSISQFVEQGLTQAGHHVEVIADGRHALTLMLTQSFDVAVIDRMLPGLDGLSLVKAMRAAQVNIPVLFLTALGGVDDRVEGLEAGADDYLTKPFAFSELLARIAALTRRSSSTLIRSNILTYGDISMDLTEHSVSRQGILLELQPKEYRILELFMRHPGKVITRTMLLEHVWDIHFDPQTSVVETHISRLRNKLEKPFNDSVLQTVRGAGYKLMVTSAAADKS
ncbi:response regulator transcription factor [Shewanella sp. NIFS-20-20]|uniref:response regulator transcription factor n=1 Tax=Shewanella sp. NIFS-20-20 TaxID=2853806 RepID=UPI001C439ADA|nr:response regulator transcription factor [Shewanella sp. NIFS-20-20]MBV7314391.1 response regulator transcription factor [Shewanella sp. NIFS-20-20]